MWPIVMNDTLANLPARAVSTCPTFGCGQPIGVDQPTGIDPPRWFCPTGHSGYFQRPDLSARPRAFPPGDAHSSRLRGMCSECGGPVRKPARKCLDCRRDGAHA